MGKRYRCSYCDKIMVSNPAIVKTHNKGLVHQRLVHDHYQQFKDPAVILKEESGKKPCKKHISASCQFGYMCKFSHYTAETIEFLKQCVADQKAKKPEEMPSFQDLYETLQAENSIKIEQYNVLCDKIGYTHVLPWSYNDNIVKDIPNLPESLKKVTVEDFAKASFAEWG